jgi:hypothetical protein
MRSDQFCPVLNLELSRSYHSNTAIQPATTKSLQAPESELSVSIHDGVH